MTKIFSSKYKIYYEDTDAGGIVYYANHLKFFERARTDLLHESKISQTKAKNDLKILFVVRNCNISYKYPAKFEDNIIIESKIVKIGKSYIEFLQTMIAEDGKKIISQAVVNIACIDCENMKPKKIPLSIIEALN